MRLSTRPGSARFSEYGTILQNVKLGVQRLHFTGDVVSHDNDDQLSLAYVSYQEEVVYSIFKGALGNIPLYPTLGNHDSWPEAFNTQNELDDSSSAMDWNYDLLSSMWANDSWINSTEASYAATHYAAYAHTHASGLRIISINTDFRYPANLSNFRNVTNPDTSGILKFVVDELSACEARNQRAWIISHVLSDMYSVLTDANVEHV